MLQKGFAKFRKVSQSKFLSPLRSTVSGNAIDKVSDLLFRYRNILQYYRQNTYLFLKRVPKRRLSFLKPSLQESVENRQEGI